jgi:hypothetical protein
MDVLVSRASWSAAKIVRHRLSRDPGSTDIVDCMIIVGVFPAAMSDWYLAEGRHLEYLAQACAGNLFPTHAFKV